MTFTSFLLRIALLYGGQLGERPKEVQMLLLEGHHYCLCDASLHLGQFDAKVL